MLVLSRHKGEQIVIDNDIVITITDIRGDRCKVGIEAPQDVTVRRAEIPEDFRRNQQRRESSFA